VKKCILIIDDEADLLEAVTELLEVNRFRCQTATTAKEGLKKAGGIRPHLILLDLNMPAMSGFGCIRELKRDPELQGIPVVVLTAINDEDVAKEAIDLGADAFLAKTCSPRELISVVSEHLLH